VSFLHPLVLLGLAAAVLPALLHLLERRRPPQATFPAVRYLSQAERQSARRLKLRHLLLLLLRTAVITLVVLAAARPLVSAPGGRAHAPTALVVILDNSPSSGVVVDGRPLFERLRAVARSSLGSAGPADRLWLLLADGVVRRGERAALLAAVESATVSPWRLDVRDAVERAMRVVAVEPLAAREVHVVSDLQRTALGAGRVTAAPSVRVLALAPLVGPLPNRGVGMVEVSGGAASVPLLGTPGTGPGAVTVRLAGRTIGRALAAPGVTVSVPLPVLGPGWWVGDAVLDPDELRADDRRLFVWHISPPRRVHAGPEVGPFIQAALAVLRDARRVAQGPDVGIAERPGPGTSVVLPPADPALVGETNRALAARGVRWHFAGPGTPGRLVAPGLDLLTGVAVARRERIAGGEGRGSGMSGNGGVLATVNGEPWLVRDSGVVLCGSRLDTAWTALPATTGFVPFVDLLVNELAPGTARARVAEGIPHVEFERRGADTVGATVYGPDPRESDLTAAPVDLVARVLGAQVLDEAHFAAARFVGTRRTDASGVLLVLALLVAAAELAVATLGT